jgi:hypothetical protein
MAAAAKLKDPVKAKAEVDFWRRKIERIDKQIARGSKPKPPKKADAKPKPPKKAAAK